MNRQRRRLLTAAACVGSCLPVIPAWASARSARTMRLVVAYPPGGVSDATARLLAEALGARLGITVIVEHRPGNGGRIALASLARGPADGSMLVFSAITPLIVDAAGEGVPSGQGVCVAPVAGVMETPQLVVATPALDADSLSSALAAARQRPGQLRWASSGLATTGHLIMERVVRASATQIIHVPYHGGGRQLTDALGGQFELLSTNVAELQLRHVRAGAFKPLAVGAPSRLAVLPSVPTLAEEGFPSANLSSLFGLFAAPNTGASTLDSINAAVNDVVRGERFARRLSLTGNLVVSGSREVFAARVEEARSASVERSPAATDARQ